MSTSTLSRFFGPFREGTTLLVHNERYLFDAVDLATGEPVLEGGWTSEAFARITTLSEWADAFLCRPNDDLGRVGPVCPYARAAIGNRLFLLGEIDMPLDARVGFAAEIRFYKEWFVTLQAALGPERNACMVLSLPHCDPESTEVIDEVQEQLKDEFISEKLMVGQFHPRHEAPGLWNADFRPLVAPIPALAIRSMVASDLPFLVDKSAWVQTYLDVFAPAIPRHTVNYLTSLIVRDDVDR